MLSEIKPPTDEELFGDADSRRPGDRAAPRSPRADADGPARPPRDKPIDGSMAKAEISRALCLLYNLSHRLLKVDKRYRAADFGEEADGIYDLVGQHAELRIILRLAAPLAGLGALWEKVEDTIERVRERRDAIRRARDAANPAATANIVGSGNGRTDAGAVGAGPFVAPKS